MEREICHWAAYVFESLPFETGGLFLELGVHTYTDESEVIARVRQDQENEREGDLILIIRCVYSM